MKALTLTKVSEILESLTEEELRSIIHTYHTILTSNKELYFLFQYVVMFTPDLGVDINSKYKAQVETGKAILDSCRKEVGPLQV